MFKIAIDLMGGDNAPKQPIQGIKAFIKSNPKSNTFFYLVGEENKISAEINKELPKNRFKLIHTKHSITMEDNPLKVIKEKTDSSMIQCLQLLNRNEVDSVISAGNTGALIFASTIIVKKIPGVKKVILAPRIPNKYGNFILADVGANINMAPKNYTNMAILCTIYSKLINGLSNPVINLLNIGQEESKGTKDLVDAYQQLKKDCDNFAGNIEPRHIMDKKTDIVLCDGFTGNIVLKLTEGISHYLLNTLISNSEEKSIKNIKNLKNIFNFQLSTILLGLNGIVLKCHGSSNYKSFEHAIKEAKKLNDLKLINKINLFLNSNLQS